MQGFYNGTQQGLFVRSTHPIEDPARLQRLYEPGERGRRTLRLGEDLWGDVHSAGGCPLQEFSAVEAVLIVDPIGWQDALSDPAVDCFFGDLKEL